MKRFVWFVLCCLVLASCQVKEGSVVSKTWLGAKILESQQAESPVVASESSTDLSDEMQPEALTKNQELRKEYEEKSTELKETIAEIQERNNQQIQAEAEKQTQSQKEIILANMKKKEEQQETNNNDITFTANTKSSVDLQAQRDKVMNIKPTVAQTKINLTLSDFPDAGKTWWVNLNPSNEMIPGQFKSIYFNTASQKVLQTTSQDTISILRAGGFNTKDFWAYFVGGIDITSSDIYEFFLSESWSSSRVILDGKEILRTGKDTVALQLEPKKYKLEVEYLNTWHVGDLAVRYSQKRNIYTMEEAKAKLASIARIDDLEVWYTWAYESTNPDYRIPVVLKPTSNPVVLMLGSYSTVDWEISNPSNVDIKAVIYAGYEPWIKVSWWLSSSVPVIKLDTYFYTYKVLPDCREMIWSMYYCEWSEKDFNKILDISTDLLGKKPTGFSGKYGSSLFTIPEMVLDTAGYAKIQSDLDAIERKKKEFNDKKNMNNVFQ